jgi:hypothetical protein
VPLAAQTLFRAISDQLIVCRNDPYRHIYRLVTFQVGETTFLLLTDRQELTTFQVIVLYAYRWQVELLFRFLKRTMHGIHLINHSEDGVTIQFYMLLSVALLQLHVKQQTVRQGESLTPAPAQDTPLVQDSIPPSPLLSKNVFHDLSSNRPLSHPYHFFEMIGDKLTTYWKLGIHWLYLLRSLLDHPFDDRAIELLGSG